jgi:potassium efflux system protein
MSRPFACLCRWLVLIAVLLTALAAVAQPAAGEAPGLESAKAELDRIDTALKREGLAVQALYDLAQSLAPVREDLRHRIAEAEPKLAQTEARLKQLGPAPPKDAPPEAAALAEERTRLTQEFAALDAALKQTRSLLARADQLADQITERRRAAYASQLFAQTPSVLSPAIWLEAGRAVGGELAGAGDLMRAWWDLLRDPNNRIRVLWAVLALIVLAVAIVLLWRWWQRRIAAAPGAATRFGKALGSLGVLARAALTAPLVTFAVIEVLEGFALLPDRLIEIAYGLGISVAIAAFGRAVTVAALAPDVPERRLVAIDDPLAQSLTRHFTWAARAMAAAAFLLVVH